MEVLSPWQLYLALLLICALLWGGLALAIYGAMELLDRIRP